MSVTTSPVTNEPDATDEGNDRCLSGTEAARLLGITYRRLDHHLRTIGTLEGKVTPGSGHPRCLRQEDLFAIAMVAMVREAVGGSTIDFEALLPRLYRAFEEDARIVLDTGDNAVTVVVDGTHIRDEIAAAWDEMFTDEDEVPTA